MAFSSDPAPLLPGSMRARLEAWLRGVLGHLVLALCIAGAASLLTWSAADPSFSRTTDAPTRNLLGPAGANLSDLIMRMFGLAGVFLILPPTFWALQLITRRRLVGARLKLILAPLAVLLLACAASSLPRVAAWPLPFGLGGYLGDQALGPVRALLATVGSERVAAAAGVFCFAGGMILLLASLGLSPRDLRLIYRDRRTYHFQFVARAWRRLAAVFDPGPSNPVRREPTFGLPPHSIAIDRMTAWRAEPSLNWEAPASGRGQFSLDGGVNIPEAARDPEFDGRTERESHAMARRFAPSRNEAPGTGASRFRLRRMPMPDSIRRRVAQSTGGPEGASPRTGRPREGAARRRPIWPGSVPEPTERDRLPASRSRPMTGDELYGRAVAIVCADRKATIEYLQQRLGIGYMRAADLIERMQQEGILGAPVRNGTRPILGRAPRSGVV